MSAMATPRVHTQTRWDPDLYELIRAFADQRGISINAATIELVRDGLDARQRNKEGKSRVSDES